MQEGKYTGRYKLCELGSHMSDVVYNNIDIYDGQVWSHLRNYILLNTCFHIQNMYLMASVVL